MSEIRNLTRNGETFYPLTCTDAVIDRDGNPVEIINDIFDISEYNASGTPPVLAKYASLDLALAAVPQSKQKGGMTVRYVQTSDNKYVQWRYMGTAVIGTPNPFLDTANWQGVDEDIKWESKNLIKSGGAYKAIKNVDSEINGFFNYTRDTKLLIDGTEEVDSTSIVSDCVEAAYGDSFEITSGNGYVCAYDSDFNFLDYWAARNFSLTNQKVINVAYLRATFLKEDINRGIEISRNGTVVWSPRLLSDGVKQEIEELNGDISKLGMKVSSIIGDFAKDINYSNTNVNVTTGEETANNSRLLSNYIYAERDGFLIYNKINATYASNIDVKVLKYSSESSEGYDSATAAWIYDNTYEFPVEKGYYYRLMFGPHTTAEFTPLTKAWLAGVVIELSGNINEISGEITELNKTKVLVSLLDKENIVDVLTWENKTQTGAANTARLLSSRFSGNGQIEISIENAENNDLEYTLYDFSSGTPTYVDSGFRRNKAYCYNINSSGSYSFLFCRVSSSAITKQYISGVKIKFNLSNNDILSNYPPDKTLPVLKNLSRHFKDLNGTSHRPFVLLHFSDLHIEWSNLNRIIEFRDAYQYLSFANNIDLCLHTGDMSNYDADISEWKPDNGVLNIIGNHEFMNNGVAETQLSVYNKFYKPFVDWWGIRYFTALSGGNLVNTIKTYPDWTGGTSYVLGDTVKYNNKYYVCRFANSDATFAIGKWVELTTPIYQPENADTYGLMYYHKDFADFNLRLVVLDYIDWDADQLSWFTAVLADAKENEYHVVVAVHQPAILTVQDKNNGFDSWDLKSNTSGTINSNAVAAVENFISEGGNFVCWLCGHNHVDHFGVGTQEGVNADQLSIVIATANITATIDMYRNANDHTADCFNVMAIDTAKSQIKLWRIGADYDRLLRHKGVLAYDYKEHELLYCE